MAFFLEEKDSSFHPGEEKIRNLFSVPSSRNPTAPYLHFSTAAFLTRCALLILGSLDSQNRPWSSIAAGSPGFMKSLSRELLAVSGRVAVGDPILDNLSLSGERMVAGLGMDLATRSRTKLFGRVGDGMKRLDKEDGTLQVIWTIEQSLGNCPKYITTRRITLAPSANSTQPGSPAVVPEITLSKNALALIQTADIFFITTRNGLKDMDTNMRGGPSGFVRILPPSSTNAPTSIIWPEYSGNRLYQTLGNLAVNPEAGITFTDFVTGNILYLTGTTEIMTTESGLGDILPRSNLAVKFTIEESRYIEAALPIRESDIESRELSPYNPPVRYLSTEKAQPPITNKRDSLRAKLDKVTTLTPTTAIFRFSLLKPHSALWEAGQYIAFEFVDEVGPGRRSYRHMNDSDPKSLNDDYIRTFTIISEYKNTDVVEVLVRKVGVVTGWMFTLIRNNRMDIEIPVRGFGGSFKLISHEQGKANFIAGGVGITPLIPFLKNNGENINVWWTVRIGDIGIVREILKRYPGLKGGMKVFITGGEERDLEGLEGISVSWRRIEKKDLVPHGGQNKEKWNLCGPSGVEKYSFNLA